MNDTFKLVTAAAAAVVVAAVIGLNLLPGTTAPGVGAPSSASPSPNPSPTASPGPTASPDSRAVPNGPMTAGRYHIDVLLYHYLTSHTVTPGVEPPLGSAGPFSDGQARVTFDLPEGWSGNGWAVFKGDASPPHPALAPITIHRVFLDPCHTTGAEDRGDIADPPLMRSLDGLADALTAWWGVGLLEPGAPPPSQPATRFAPTSPTATYPRNVTFAGSAGRYVEVRTPSDLDIAACDGGKYMLFADAVGGQRWVQGPGQLDRLWLVDVDGGGSVPRLEDDGTTSQIVGGLLVIDAASHPDTSTQDLAELQAIVDSIEVELLDES